MAVSAIPTSELGAIEVALPGTAWVWSRFSDQLIVTVTPSAATAAELSVGAVVSTTKERITLKEEPAARSEERRVGKEYRCPWSRCYPLKREGLTFAARA